MLGVLEADDGGDGLVGGTIHQDPLVLIFLLHSAVHQLVGDDHHHPHSDEEEECHQEVQRDQQKHPGGVAAEDGHRGKDYEALAQ